jgi:sorting nexin-7/30/sorting nexin-8
MNQKEENNDKNNENISQINENKTQINENKTQINENKTQINENKTEINENYNKVNENQIINNNEQNINSNQIEKKIFKIKEKISSQKQSISILGSTKNIIVNISEYSKIEAKNILSKSYITYKVMTLPFNYSVNRRYSDFEWIRQILSSLYAGHLIPSIPKKKIGDRFNESFILKRMRTLEKFLNFLLTDPIIRNNVILNEFLKIENFNEIKKKYEKIKFPSLITEYFSLNGKLDLTVDKERENKFKEIKEDINNNEILYKKLTMSMKQLNNEMNIVNNRINEISNIFNNLFKITEKYNYYSTIIQAFKNSSEFFKYFYETNKKNLEIIFINFREYFKYIKNIYRGLKENINTIEQAKNTFYSSESKLKTKKESLFSKGETSKWGLDSNDKTDINTLLNNKTLAFEKMLYKENKNLKCIKNNYGFYLNKGLNEFERIRNFLSLKNIDTVFDYGNKFKLNIDELSAQYKSILNDLLKEKLKFNENEQNNRTDPYYPIELEPFSKEFHPEEIKDEKEELNDNNDKNKEETIKK